MRRLFFGMALASVGLLAASANAAVVYDTTTGGAFHSNTFGPVPMLDDVTIGSAPATISAIQFGYENLGSDPEDVDAVVTLWDNVDTSTTDDTVINTGSLGTFRIHVGSINGGDQLVSGLLTIPTPIAVTDESFGVQLDFDFTGTSDLSDVQALVSDNLPTVGSTVDQYWSDDLNPDDTFEGDEAVYPNPGTPDIHENLYLRLDATVPEPASLPGLIVAAAGLMTGRRRSARGA